MRQCQISKGPVHQVAWLDVKPSDQGRFVNLKTGSQDDNDWKIDRVSEIQFSDKWINERSRDFKNMRKMTDI